MSSQNHDNLIDAPMQRALSIEIEATETELWALAQFIKRVGWREFRENAIDDEEAYSIREGVERLQSALSRKGYAPR